jgi:hypothetical protein
MHGIRAVVLGLIAVISGVSLALISASEALAWGHRSHYGHSYHSQHRGETCWRTNRSTGQHFRIC